MSQLIKNKKWQMKNNIAILALDFGTKKVGLAISHGLLAEPLKSVLYRGQEKEFYSHIAKIITEQKVGKIVIGLPLDSGQESLQSRWSREQAVKLSEKIKLEIEFVDESFTTLQAIDELSGDGDIDSQSAKIILEQYLTEGKHNG